MRKAGESFIIPKGLRCRWTQPGHVKKFFVIFEDASGLKNEGPLRTIKIDPAVTLAPSTPPAAAMLRIAAERGPEKSMCPTDVARAVSAENWRPLLGAVRQVAAELARQGKIEILRKGKPINPDEIRGVIRLRAIS